MASLTSVSPATVTAYRHDVEAFVAWAGRLGVGRPAEVDRRVRPPLPRLPRHPALRPRTIARRLVVAAALVRLAPPPRA